MKREELIEILQSTIASDQREWERALTCRELVLTYCAINTVHGDADAVRDEIQFRTMALKAVDRGTNNYLESRNSREILTKLQLLLSPHAESVPAPAPKLNAALVLFRAFADRRIKLTTEEIEVLHHDLVQMNHWREAEELQKLKGQAT